MVVRAPASRRSPAQTDERLLVEAAQKNPGRFADLYELHFERVYAFVVRRTGERDAAEDLTADVFHKALANLGRFEWRGVPFGAWLLKIAANAITDRAKKSGRELTFDDPPEISAKPRMELSEDRTQLYRLVDELPADQKRVVVMRFAEEKSIRDIAQQLGRSEGAVKQLQFRALAHLRQRFEASRGQKPQRTQGTKRHTRQGAKKSGAKNG